MKKESLVVEMALANWSARVKQVDKLLESISDEDLLKEVSPGRNRGIYIIGHLAAIHDRIIPLLDLGHRLHPEIDKFFIEAPDKTVKEIPTISEVRNYFKNVNEALTHHFNTLHLDEWFERHTSVSEEDFAKEPNRNKLSILMSRTMHFSFHAGQLILLKSK